MNYNKKTILDVDVAGKKILLRCDFNVPQDKETGAITSDKRIVAALPTIRYLLEKKAAVIACSHLGKPKGEWKTKLSLAPVAQRLSELLGQEVIFAKDIVGEDAKAKAAALQGGQIMLRETLPCDPREKKNAPPFPEERATRGELDVPDALAPFHRPPPPPDSLPGAPGAPDPPPLSPTRACPRGTAPPRASSPTIGKGASGSAPPPTSRPPPANSILPKVRIRCSSPEPASASLRFSPCSNRSHETRPSVR